MRGKKGRSARVWMREKIWDGVEQDKETGGEAEGRGEEA